MNDYIWTYWTKPQGGKISYFDIACIGLSTALAKKHGNAKAIYTDTRGAEQIERYNIDVPAVVTLDEINREDPRKWAIPKINTYSKIKEPCTHIDYDVFLWKEQKPSNSDFCCQSLEEGDNFFRIYRKTFHNFFKDAGYCPKEIEPFSSKEKYTAYNLGYFQINNADFLNRYAEEAFGIFSRMKTFHNHNNVFPEQYLFYCMATSGGMSVDVLFDNEKSLDEQCTSSGYTHLMEEKRKNKRSVFKRIMEKLKIENTNCHDAISKEIDWSLYDVGKSLITSAASFISSGMETVDDSTYEERKEICKNCEHYDADGYGGQGRCSICKCNMKAKPKLASSACPVGKW